MDPGTLLAFGHGRSVVKLGVATDTSSPCGPTLLQRTRDDGWNLDRSRSEEAAFARVDGSRSRDRLPMFQTFGSVSMNRIRA